MDSGKSETNPKDSFKALSLKPVFTPSNLALKYKKAAKKEKTKSERSGDLFFPKIEADDVIFLNMIGEGSFGQVWKARWKNEEYAIKIVPKALTKEEYEEIKTEVETMFACPHENVLRLVGASIDPKQGKSCLIATELCDHSVTHKITQKLYNKTSFPYQAMKAKLEDAKAIAIGIHWIHEVNRISHGDLKPDNILVKKGVLKIADFGFAAFRDKAQVIDKRGTPYYMAPEVIQVKMGSKDAKPYNVFKADIYSYSMILYCIFRGVEVPFPEFSAWAPFANAILSGYRPKLDTDWPPMLQKLLEGCWAADAEKRPDWEEIIFILNELIVDSCSFNAKVRKFWKNNFFYNNDDYYLETKVPWKKFATTWSQKTATDIVALNSTAQLFLNHGTIPDSDKALFDNFVTIEALDIMALVFGSSFLSKNPKKIGPALEQLKLLAKSHYWHGVIDSGKANSRLAAEGRDKNCLLRCRHPRHPEKTGASLSVSLRDGDIKQIYVYFDQTVDSNYYVYEGESTKSFPNITAVLEHFSKGYIACPRSASYSMQS